MLLFALLIFLFDVFAVQIPGRTSTISLSFVPALSAIMLFSPLVAATASVLALTAVELLNRKQPLRLVFNCSQGIIATLAASFTYTAMGGQVGNPDWQGSLLPLLATGLVFQLINTTSTVAVIALHEGSSLYRTWLKFFKWSAPNYLALIPLALALAMAFNSLGILGVAFFCLPLLVARYAFKLHEDLLRTFHELISALAAALDAKDSYTAGHSERVGRLAALIGREMRLPETQVERLQIAGLLHDVGKIGIPDAILLKPGRFTPQEYDTMKQHAVLSGKILADVERLGEVSRWVACHHERWNGCGYPAGLRGEEIPLGARILAVADACDAMLSRRSYKGSFSWERARAELEDCAGQDFDPQVVKVLIGISERPDVRALLQAVGAEQDALAEAAPARDGGGMP